MKKGGFAIHSYNCGFVYFSLQFWVMSRILKLSYYVHIHLGLPCSLDELILLSLWNDLFYPWKHSLLWNLLCINIKIATPPFFWWVLAWYMFIQLLTYLWLYLKLVSCKQCIVWSCLKKFSLIIYAFYLRCLDHLHLMWLLIWLSFNLTFCCLCSMCAICSLFPISSFLS